MKVGFLGLGQMGAAMAANLVKAGHDVTVYNRTHDKTRPLAELGAHAATQVADTCRGQAVYSMVADDKALEAMVFGEAGMLGSLPKNAVHISASTISVALSEQLLEAHAKVGQRFVAAPVFGRPEAAAAAKLFIVAAGEAQTLSDCTPLFDAVGQHTFILSDHPPAANLIKLSGNFLIGSVIEALGEAMALVGKAGVDPRAYLDMLTSTLFGAPVYKTYGGLIAGRFRRPARPERYPADPGRGRDPECPDADSQPAARPVPHFNRTRRGNLGLVRDRQARGAGFRAITVWQVAPARRDVIAE
jgi:3-hydroxyisobutyrate dehydrogenase-like beta-hydroxyacid dehydrogenase